MVAGVAVIDKELAAQKIRRRLEQRLARFFECETADLPRLKLGTLIHALFLLFGDGEEIGGFQASMSSVLQILGHEIVWEVDDEKKESTPPPVVN